MREKILNFSEAKNIIKEADILLFRAPKFTESPIGWLIGKITQGIHSHVGLAHIDDTNGRDVFCVEQREFIGGRSILLENYVKKFPYRIDVYRVSPTIFVPQNYGDWWFERKFNDKLAKRITKFSLSITGKGYGWVNIWKIVKCYIPFLRLINRPKYDDELPVKVYVCSTLVGTSFRKYYCDLCPNIPDERTTPADIAKSANISYLFTIGMTE